MAASLTPRGSSHAPGRWRLFVAVPVSPAVQQALGTTQEQLRSVVPAAVATWTRPDKLHLTLRFLGDLDSSGVSALRDSLAAAVDGMEPFSLTAARLGCFPDLRRPRVLYAALPDPTGRLGLLQRRVAAATAGFGQNADRFVGHLTLARLKQISRGDTALLARQVQEMDGREFGAWTVDRVDLMRSELLAAGSRYTVLASMGLA